MSIPPPRYTLAIGLASLSLFLTACGGYSWQADLRRHASLQHGCPESQVEIISENGNALSRQLRAEVCGESRLYQHVNAGASYVWRDITNGSEDAAPYVVAP